MHEETRQEADMETLAQDVRYALRSLARRPGFAAVVVLTLALGFGANAALFSVVDAVLLRRLPFAAPEELAQVWERHERGSAANVVSPANFADWRREARGFADLAGYWRQPISLTGLGEPEEVQATIASPGIFRLLGVPAAAGRLLAEDDVAAGQFTGEAAVLSYDFWQRRFGGDPEVVGSSVTLGTSSVAIVGVAPPAARLVEPATDVWMPTSFEWANRVDMGRFISVVGRRAPGVSPQQAQAEMDAVARRLAQAHPELNAGWGVNLVPLAEQLVGDARPALLLLFGAVGLLLLIACANVGNLMLARAAAREREIAIRAALGAGSGRIFRQVLTESALLVAAAAVAGLVAAALGSRGLLALLPADLRIPQLADVRLDASVVAFTALLALLAGLVFGLVPVLGTWTPRLMEGLREGRSEAGSGRRRGLRSGLVVAEIALALVLAAGAGLLFRSFLELRRVDTGLELDSVLTARLTLPRGRYGEPAARAAFFRQARERVAALPGVESVSAIQWLPLSGRRSATDFFVEDQPRPELGAEPVTDVRVVMPGYFETVGIPLLAGRAIDERDHAEAPAVAVINETLARRYWPGEDPVGRRLSYDWGDWVSVEVIGVGSTCGSSAPSRCSP
jgi:putative ABC transport system permease protein